MAASISTEKNLFRFSKRHGDQGCRHCAFRLGSPHEVFCESGSLIAGCLSDNTGVWEVAEKYNYKGSAE